MFTVVALAINGAGVNCSCSCCIHCEVFVVVVCKLCMVYPLIVQPLAPYMVLVCHIFTALQYTFETLQELFRHNKYVLLLFY